MLTPQACQGPLDGIPSPILIEPLSLVSPTNFLKVHSIPLSMPLVTILNTIDPKTKFQQKQKTNTTSQVIL